MPTPTDAKKEIINPAGDIVNGSFITIKMMIDAMKLIKTPTVPPLKDIKEDSIRN